MDFYLAVTKEEIPLEFKKYPLQITYANSSQQKPKEHVWDEIKREVQIIAAPIVGDGLKIPISYQESIQQGTPSTQRTEHTGDNQTDIVTLAPGDYLTGTFFKTPTPEDIRLRKGVRRGSWIHLYDILLPSPYKIRLPEIKLSPQDITRWKMAWRAINAFKFRDGDGTPFRTSIKDTIKSRCQDWPGMSDASNFSIALRFSPAAFIYGGLHALAWFAHFGSSTEQFLWRSSACVVMGGVPVFYIIGAVMAQPAVHTMPSVIKAIFAIFFMSVPIVLLAYRSR